MDPGKPGYEPTAGVTGQDYAAPPPPPYVPPSQDYAGAPTGTNPAPGQTYAPQGPPYAAAPAPMGMHAPSGGVPVVAASGGVPPGGFPPGGVAYVATPGGMPPAGAPPGTVVYTKPGGPGFTTGLCDCCEGKDGPIGCLISWLIPCWGHGIIGDVVADGVGRVPPCALTCGLYSLAYIGNCFWGVCYPYNLILEVPAAIGFIVVAVFGRKKMREKYGIPGNAFPGDCCTVYWCHCCSIAQEMRHIRDHMPNQDFELLENREARRTDLDFLKRATAPFFG